MDLETGERVPSLEIPRFAVTNYLLEGDRWRKGLRLWYIAWEVEVSKRPAAKASRRLSDAGMCVLPFLIFYVACFKTFTLEFRAK